MNRRILAGALALALPMAGVATIGVTAAGAKTPTLSSVVFKDTGNSTVTTIAPFQNYTLIINGSNLPAVTTSSIVGSISGDGLYALLGSPLTVNSIITQSATQIKASVEGPTGDNIFFIQQQVTAPSKGTGYQPGTLTISLVKKPATAKKPATYSGTWTSPTPDVVSNCGSTLPVAATAGNTYTPYASGPNEGQLNLSTGVADTGGNSTDYFDVVINALLATGNLCSDDIGTATTVGSPAYNSNYPVTFTSGGSVPSHSIKNVQFSFPYTANNTLSVYGEQEQFQLSGTSSDFGGAVCGGLGATQPSGVTLQSCTVSSSGLVTLTATGTTTYTTGATITSPTFSILGLSTSGLTLTPVSTTSEIGLYTPPASGTPHPGSCTYSSSTNTWTTVQGSNGTEVCTSIIFAPRGTNVSFSVALSS